MICVACGQETGRVSCDQCGGIAALDRRYRLDRVLHRAPQLTVYVGRHLATKEEVVVSEHPLPGPPPPAWEAALATSIAQARKVSLSGASLEVDAIATLTRGQPALFGVRRYVEGWPLTRVMAGKQTAATTLEVLDELLGTLSALHLRYPPIVHRDLHLGNVIRAAEDGRLVLVGFAGLRDSARALSGADWELPVPYAHLAPELFTGEAAPAVDLYGLGVLAVQLLAGREPRHLLDRGGEVRWRGKVPDHPDLELLLEDLLQVRPDRRPTDAAEVHAFVRAMRDGQAGREREEPPDDVELGEPL
ncbi:MAG: hypothetical protein JXX28_01930 [Deltaproteobacteria bacterium]|nr:hypothetical protein [Deltaproteobacteria bacterium]